MGASLSFPEVDLAGKVAIVTGGNTGIGYETSKALARMGAHVVLACRSEERAKNAIEKMKSELAEAKPVSGEDIKIEFMALDLTSLASARDFAKAYLARNLPLHLLILNAGIAMIDPLQMTDDGLEKMFQVNYLGHLLILLYLLELLKSNGPDVRVVSVASAAYKMGLFDLTNMDGSKSYGRAKFYGNSKLYQIMMTFHLQKKLSDSGISFFSLHPGIVSTEITRGFNDSKFWMAFTKASRGIGVSRNAEKGAATTINAAVNPEFANQKALYFEDCKAVVPGKHARNESDHEELWAYSVNLLRRYIDDDCLAKLNEMGLTIRADSPSEAAAVDPSKQESQDVKEKADD
ncbi:retinol dehydrogenase 12-like [Oscarella lobularis]|uniref:retinol dehydrogenase 12-like n=1 Tax=Oscarella lobularis TaxID=121494 RepID=UPI003313ED57